MHQAYQLRTKHKSKLLFAMMNALAGEDASISFEGRLSNTCLVKIAGGRFEETEVLRRRKLQPRLDFLVLPLTFAAYDQFHQDSVVAFPAVPIALLNELVL